MEKIQLAQYLQPLHQMLMTHKMSQALRILQLPVMELASAISDEMEQNPLLEYSEVKGKKIVQEKKDHELFLDEKHINILNHLEDAFKEHFSQNEHQPRKTQEDASKINSLIESQIIQKVSLFEFLMQQATLVFSKENMKIAEIIIGNLDDHGFFGSDLVEIATANKVKLTKLKMILKEIQNFEPSGIASLNVQDCLLRQLKGLRKERTLAYKIVKFHFDALLHNHIPHIMKELNVSASEVMKIISHDLSHLTTNPAASFDHSSSPTIIPDLFIKDEGENLIVYVNDLDIPSVRFNPLYLKMLKQKQLNPETKKYILGKISSGRWLMRSIHERDSTLLKIGKFLSEKQKHFFSNPEGELKPLTMHEIADCIGMNTSTIARVVSRKYIACSRGIFPLRSFFSFAFHKENGEDISSRDVKEMLLELLKYEDKKKPKSDHELAKFIQEKGIPCARRTIAKYRQELKIGTSHQRKKFS